MSEMDPSARYQRLVETVEAAASDEELLSAAQNHEGGIDGLLDEVFAGMVAVFNPQKAAGQQATAQYEITAPDGTRSYWMRVADGSCTIERGTIDNPRVTLRLGLTDFLRLLANKANGMQLFMTGKLKVSGDLFFAQTLQTWFTPPPR